MLVEQFDRLWKYSLNPDNQKMYANEKEQKEGSKSKQCIN